MGQENGWVVWYYQLIVIRHEFTILSIKKKGTVGLRINRDYYETLNIKLECVLMLNKGIFVDGSINF